MSSLSTSSKNKAELKDRILQDNILQLPSEFLRKYAKSMLENPCRFMTLWKMNSITIDVDRMLCRSVSNCRKLP